MKRKLVACLCKTETNKFKQRMGLHVKAVNNSFVGSALKVADRGWELTFSVNPFIAYRVLHMKV